MALNYLKFLALGLLGLSLACFIYLAWFLLTTPADSFDTQGPGLSGAFVMFGGQVLAAAGLVLLIVWKEISLLLASRKSAETS